MISSACFDLETSSLNANFGIILCGVITPAGGKPVIFRNDKLNPDWATKRFDDSKVVLAITKELSKYDILIAHNGHRFDLPYLRTRLAYHKLGSFPKKKLIDPYAIAKSQFRMSSNSLDALSDFLTRSRKTPVAGHIWMRAVLDGCKKSMDYIVDHCVKDVDMLGELVDFLKDYSPVFNDRGSW